MENKMKFGEPEEPIKISNNDELATYFGAVEMKIIQPILRDSTARLLEQFINEWDTEEHGFVHITEDFRLIPTNNRDIDGIYLSKKELKRVVSILRKPKNL